MLLLNTYVNDLNYFVSNASLRLYADDTTEYASDVSPMVLQCVIKSDLGVLSRWFGLNHLQINAAKTQALVIGPSLYEYEFHLNNARIGTQDTIKMLGIVLDSKLTFKAHIKEQLKKACAKASALRKLRKFIPNHVMVRLYKVYVLSHIEYCSPLLLGISNAETTKMETTNYYLLRSILGYLKSVSYDYLLKIVNIESLEQRTQFQSLFMLYTATEHPILVSSFNLKNVKCNLRGLSTRLELPPFNLEYMHRSFTFLVSKLWNALPPMVRESKEIASFKRALKVHMT